MATVIWRGDAPAVAQVTTIQITAYDAATTYKATINGKVVSVIAAGSVNDTATALQVALAASTIVEFTEVTWTVATDTVTGTCKTKGLPFTVTSSVSGGTGTIGAATTSTAASGPNDWSVAANWSGGAVPVNGDDVYLENSAVGIYYGFAQSAVTLTSLNVAMSFTGYLGLPKYNAAGYYEYRATELAISATTVNIGRGVGNGSGRIKINTGTAQTTLNVFNSGQPVAQDAPAILWRGTHASNAANVLKGSVGVCFYAGEAATLVALNVGYVTSQASDASVIVGSGATLTNLVLNQTGGRVELNAATSGTAALTQSAGELWLVQGGHVGLLVQGGTCFYVSTGTLGGAPVVSGTGALNFERDPRAKTVTNPIDVFDGGAIFDQFKVVASLVADFNQGSDPAKSRLGRNYRVTRGTPA